MQERKQHLRDILLKGIERELTSQHVIDSNAKEDVSEDMKINVLDSDIIYYICGYIVHSFRKRKARRQEKEKQLSAEVISQPWMLILKISPQNSL